MRRRLRWVRDLLAGTRARVRARDLTLTSAGASLFGSLAVVPSLLAAVALAQLVLGRDLVIRTGHRLADSLPEAMGAVDAAGAVLQAGLALTPLGVLFTLVMGSAYGDGLSRALVRFAPVDDDARPPAWWVRAATLPLLGLAPLMLSGLLLAAPYLEALNRTSGLGGTLLAVYLSLTLVWILTWLPLTWAFRVVAPGRPSWRASLLGAVITGAFVSGFLQGFLLFLSLPVDLARPFGGLPGVGVATALLLWLWVLHAVVCVGYAMTWELHARLGNRAE